MKTVMVTGSNVGIGKEAARQLASIEGIEKVILACLNKSEAQAAAKDLEISTGKKIFEVVVVDTSDLASVRKAMASVDNIDGLIMNAGGALGLDLTSDGVTMSFAVNVLGHVVLTEELIKAGKLSGSVVYVATEEVRGVDEFGLKRVKLPEHSVEEFKKVASGQFVEELKSSDPQVDNYGLVKYMGTLWTSYMARQHPGIRFMTVSPGLTYGTDATKSLPTIKRVFFVVLMRVLSLFGKSHGVKVGAKRYIDVLIDGKTYKTGEFYASKKGVSGPMCPQSESSPSIIEYKDAKIQDNAVQAIHNIINQKDLESRANAKAKANTVA